jgi:hypothetical protein
MDLVVIGELPPYAIRQKALYYNVVAMPNKIILFCNTFCSRVEWTLPALGGCGWLCSC